MSRSIIIAIDYDSTIVAGGAYPKVGEPLPLAIEYLKQFQSLGTKFILWTCRAGWELKDAADLLRSHGIELWGVNENPDPPTKSPKAYYTYCIDDRNVCTPLDKDGNVDWSIVGPLVLDRLRNNQ